MQWPAFLAARAAERASQGPAPAAIERAAPQTLSKTLAAPRPPRRARGSPDIRRARRGAQAQGRVETLAAGAAAGDGSGASSSAEGAAASRPYAEPFMVNGAGAPGRQRASDPGVGHQNPGMRGDGASGAPRRRRTWELPNPRASLPQPPRAPAACGDDASERDRTADSSEVGVDSRGASESGGTVAAYTDDADSVRSSALNGAESKVRLGTQCSYAERRDMLAQSSMTAVMLPTYVYMKAKQPCPMDVFQALKPCLTAVGRPTGWRASWTR